MDSQYRCGIVAIYSGSIRFTLVLVASDAVVRAVMVPKITSNDIVSCIASSALVVNTVGGVSGMWNPPHAQKAR